MSSGATGSPGITLPSGEPVGGFVAAGFEAVADAFVANFRERGDLGAAVAAYHEGRLVVDLWGGISDRRSGGRWTADTAAVIFSCTKGLLATCAYRLVDAGRLDLDAPIASYWPEFAAAGKREISVRDAMSHRSGLASLDVDLTRADALQWPTVVAAIERQRPRSRPPDGHLYHALTYGWIVGEVIHRITGLLPGPFFSSELAEPLALSTWIGLPEPSPVPVAWMEPPLPDEESPEAREVARLAAADPVVERSVSLGGAWGFPVENGVVSFNDPAIQAAQVPGANGISTARSLARLYAACVTPVGAAPVLKPESIQDALVVRAAGRQLSGMPDDGARWGTGFQLASPPSQPMLGDQSFGHAGAGGQLAFGDLEHGVGFAYLGNQMGGYGDARARWLTLSLRRALGR